MKHIGAVAVGVLLLMGCAGAEFPAAVLADEAEPAGETAVASDSLYVEKVEDLADSFILGADVSTLLAEEASGVVYRNFSGEEQDMLRTLAENGINYVRVRVWVDPFDRNGSGYGGGNCTAETAGKIGARAAGYGMRLLVDFHYSDFWADPSKQQAPKAWQGLGIGDKAERVRAYTFESLKAIRDAGADIGMVQIGNETTTGICGETSVPNMCAIYRAGADAVRAFDPDILVAVHFTNPEAGNFSEFGDMLADSGADYDVFATSYYPYWHGTLENLKGQLSSVAVKYGKKVMVVETQWAYTAADGDGSGNTVGEESEFEGPYPFTVQGQSREIRDVAAAVASLEGGIGVFYWEAGWIPVPGTSRDDRLPIWEACGSGWASSYAGEYDPYDAGIYYGGSACDNQALFDFDGKPLESLKTFGLLKTGNRVTPAADALESVEMDITVGKDLILPEKVTAVFSDGSREEIEVTWDAEEASEIDTSRAGRYTVRGTGSGLPALCRINVSEANYIRNPGFEDLDRSMWHITPIAPGDQADFQEKAADAYSGRVSLHFWNGNAVEWKCEQTVDGLPQGSWRVRVRGQGGDVGEDADIHLFVIADGRTFTAGMTFCGWAEWQEAFLEHIPCAGGQITVGVSVRCRGGGWGTFDDFELVPEE